MKAVKTTRVAPPSVTRERPKPPQEHAPVVSSAPYFTLETLEKFLRDKVYRKRTIFRPLGQDGLAILLDAVEESRIKVEAWRAELEINQERRQRAKEFLDAIRALQALLPSEIATANRVADLIARRTTSIATSRRRLGALKALENAIDGMAEYIEVHSNWCEIKHACEQWYVVAPDLAQAFAIELRRANPNPNTKIGISDDGPIVRFIAKLPKEITGYQATKETTRQRLALLVKDGKIII